MATEVRKITLVKSDPVNNNNKFWKGTVYSDGTVLCQWGRVGDTGQSKTFNEGSVAAAERFLDKKANEKKRDGRNGEIAYREIDVIDGGSQPSAPSAKVVQSANLTQIAKKQIKTTGDTETDKLIDFLTQQNIHNITEASGGQITYNYDTGLFQTPMGLISQAGIDSARNVLGTIYDLIDNSDYGEEMMERTRDYLMLVPQNIGRNRLDLKTFWNNTMAVTKQNGILDGLQASLATAVSAPKKDGAKSDPKAVEAVVFDTELEVVKNQKLIDAIFKNFHWSKSSQHSCHTYRPVQVWKVHIKPMRNAFTSYGKGLPNNIEGYHGTGAENLLSLLKTGFLVKPPQKAAIAGKMFGHGTYTAPCHIKGSSTKALNYSCSYWVRRSSNRTFMFICDVAMGKFFTPSGPCGGVPNGYDSCWAKGDYKSGVLNDETIVYREDQIDIKYLLELTP